MFDVGVNHDLLRMYSQPQQGGNLPYFVGRQHGGNWLQTLKRIALPILKNIGRTAGNAALKVTGDVLNENKSLKSAIIDRAKNTLPELKQHASDALKEVLSGQSGSGLRKRKRKLKHGINKRVKRTIFDK